MTSANRKLVLWGAGLLLVVATGCSGDGKGGRSRGGATAKAEVGNVEVTVTLSGTVKPFRSTIISAPYTGYIRKLYVDVGDRVKKGDPLVAFSPNLLDSEPVYPIRAAYPGLVSQVMKLDGDYVVQSSSDAKVLKLEDISSLYIESEVPEADIAKIKDQQKAVIRVNALPDRQFTGDIVQIFLSARDTDNAWDRKGGTFPIRIKIKDPVPELKTGLSAIVEIVVESRADVLRLPQEFVAREKGKYYVVRAGGKERVPVELGLRSDAFVEVQKGLKPGDEVLFPSAELDE